MIENALFMCYNSKKGKENPMFKESIMKLTKALLRTLALVLALSPLLSSCSQNLAEIETETKTEIKETKEEMKEEVKAPAAPLANEDDIAALNQLYAGRTAYYGDIHCHPLAGVAPDGKKTLAEWKVKMAELGIDFVAFMNHRQVYHMSEPEWDSTLFIGGTEPATKITDCVAVNPGVHYNMLFPNQDALLQHVTQFPEYKYTGGQNGTPLLEGTFTYPKFTADRFREIIQSVKDKGGLFVNVHPKQEMQSKNPEDYYFADYTGLEVFYGYNGSITGSDTIDNYTLWTDLLASGKRLWATAGSDSHGDATEVALTCVYSEAKQDTAYLSHLIKGDFVAGFAGIRMAIGDAKMGSSTDFSGKRLVVSIDQIHSSMLKAGRTYTVKIISDQGTVYTAEIDGKEPVAFSFDADENAAFYRVEILDQKRTAQPIIAIGNPIWND